ncbi:hypothetical protein E2C01_074609 [Portunus trituberculatus]|uniref:Uncharacterized protein n=1 Tax=Portunus trituberculatus TaxID=210409 RepID=A0A5B7ICX8_PORTR|nr:hypothetical protein [Portunus trituberculatus]
MASITGHHQPKAMRPAMDISWNVHLVHVPPWRRHMNCARKM